jgi:hypothetical protein
MHIHFYKKKYNRKENATFLCVHARVCVWEREREGEGERGREGERVLTLASDCSYYHNYDILHVK